MAGDCRLVTVTGVIMVIMVMSRMIVVMPIVVMPIVIMPILIIVNVPVMIVIVRTRGIGEELITTCGERESGDQTGSGQRA